MIDRAEAQIGMILTRDLRRLKEIQSIESKIAAKREMIPEYEAWISGILAAAENTGVGFQDDVLPTIMVWSIDTGDWSRALELAKYVLEYKIALPARYERQPATLIVEQFSEGAIAAFERDELFPHDVLTSLAGLAADHDMPDEVRAKLHKAIGLDYAASLSTTHHPDLTNAERAEAGLYAITQFARAIELNPRIGLKQKLEKLRKDVAALAPAAAPDTLPPPPPAPPADTE